MNRNLYLTRFNSRLGMQVAVAEVLPARGKGAGRGTGGRPGAGRSRAIPSAVHLPAIALAVASALCTLPALANPPLPTGGTIVSGAGSISQSGNTLTVTQSSGTFAANWQSFNIGSGNVVVFNQPGSSAVALNRVTGPDASTIYGALTANGKIFLINPNGVLFAPGAQVSVGGLVASTLDISDADFAVGRYRFTEGGTRAGAVVNQGEISAGSAVLIAPEITNSGTISTPGGQATLAAGDQVTVNLLPDGLLTAQVDVSAENTQIQNHGRILADGGEVSLVAGRSDTVADSLINTDGVIEARSIRNVNGDVYLEAGAGGTVTVSGTVDTSGSAAGAHGGNVTVLGKDVGLMAGAQVNASGSTGGGTVLVGGNWQGSGADEHAQATYMDQTAIVNADATAEGDGGNVVLWSDDYTGYYGSISARGGADGGNGGNVETSSHGDLQAVGVVDATAPAGAPGKWLLDPASVTIGSSADAGGTYGAGNPNVFTPTSSSASVSTTTIQNSLNQGTSVTIQTSDSNGNPNGGSGDITIAAGSTIAMTGNSPATLTLDADRDILVNAGASITSTNAALNLVLDAHYTNDLATGTVALGTNGNSAGITINTDGGNITIGGGKNPLTTAAIGDPSTEASAGVFFSGPVSMNAGGGNISIRGTGGTPTPSAPYPAGVQIGSQNGAGNTQITTTGSGAITLVGTGGTGASTITPTGVVLQARQGNLTIDSGSGAITINGTEGAGGTQWLTGLYLDNDGSGCEVNIFSTTGPVTLIGTAANSGNSAITSSGTVNLGWDGTSSNIGSGSLTIEGQTPGASSAGSGGIAFGAATSINGNGGNLTIGSYGGSLSGLTLGSGLIAAGATWANVTIGDAGTGAVVDSGNTLTASGSISLTGGSYSFAGNNTLTSGTLAFGNPNGIANSGTLTLAQSSGGAIGNVITGAGGLADGGTGTLALTGDNTYAGTTTINGGSTLQVGDGGTAGALGAGTVTDNGTLIFDRSDALSVANAIGGSGGLVKQGAGTVTLTSNGNGYSGDTTINGGTLVFSSSVITRVPSANFYINNASTLQFANIDRIDITGARQIYFDAAGGDTVDFAGTLTDGGINFRPGGSLTVNSQGGAQNVVKSTSGAGLNTGSGPLTLNVASGGGGLLFSAPLWNSGSLVKTGAGLAILTGGNTYFGTTTVSSGTLQVGAGGTTGTLGMGAVTDNGNLVFDRSDTVSLSTLAPSAAGITGSGNVQALIGGGLAVDRTIALTGAGSSVLLEAGDGAAAGTAAGGDVTLSSAISTASGGTVTIFSGDPNTAAYEAKIAGASGTTRYKTYGAAASSLSGAVAGARNYYYRAQPSLTVTGLTASETYDGRLDAASVLSGSGASVTGGIDGDTASYGALTLSSASFDSAHAGTRTVTASYGASPFSYTSAGITWAVSGYGGATGTGTGTITPKALTVGINPVGKTYDGLTATTSTLGTPTGFIGNDSASGVSGVQLAFDDPNAGAHNIVASGTGTLIDFVSGASGNGSGVGAGNEVAGLASDYTVGTPTPASAVISPAALTVTANDDAKIVTQSDPSGYNAASFSGFVDGQGPSVLSGSLAITRSNAGTQAAGTYAGVLVPSGYDSGNYQITYVNGNFQILPAQQLLVRVQNASNDYGSTPSYLVSSAEYLDANGSTFHTLTETAHSGNTYTFSDGVGGSVTFTLTPQGAVKSDAGYVAVGNYTLSGSNTHIGGNNFLGLTFVGNQSVTPIPLTPAPRGAVSKVYDGTDAVVGLTMSFTGELSGDQVQVDGGGTFSSKNAGNNLAYAINGMTLTGADAGDYYLSSGSFSGNNGAITPRPIAVSGITADDKVYDSTAAVTLTTSGATLNGVISGDAVGLDALGYSASFIDRNAGTGKSVTVTGLTLNGADAGNYSLSQPMGLTASITPRPLTITAVSNTKRYDGTTAAAGIPLVSGPLALGDSLATLDEVYGSKAVGTGLTLVPVVSIDDGNGGQNYAITFIDSAQGVIELPNNWIPGDGSGSGGIGAEAAGSLTGTRGGASAEVRGGGWLYPAQGNRGAAGTEGGFGNGSPTPSAQCERRIERNGLLKVDEASMRLPFGLAQNRFDVCDSAAGQ